ncbi:MAG: glycosyltransferase [Patescibacteria group bacterium]
MLRTSVDIVVPVYNEEIALPANIPILYNYCRNNLSEYSWRIIIADNASTDSSSVVARKFAKSPQISYLKLPKKGRGLALRTAWLESKADIVSYMDVDLSSNLEFFPALLSAIENNSDIAIGSRLARGSNVVGRTLLREIMSRGYNLLIKAFFSVSFKDAQCGFKAVKKTVFKTLEPLIKNDNWFFDSEMLILAEKSGYKVAEIPISWHDDPSSTVKVARTASEDFEGLLRLWKDKPWLKLKKTV